MGLSNQLGYYDDCLNIFERAATDTRGVRIMFDREPAAKHFMFRMHQARSLLRAESMRIHERGEPQWGKSAYDTLIVRLPKQDTEGNWWVYIEHLGNIDNMVIESLSEDSDE